MSHDNKEYIDDEIRKIELKLMAESERIQRVVAESRLNFYIKVFTALGATIALALPVIISLMLSSQNRSEFDRLEQKVEKQSIEVSQRLDQKGSLLEQRLDSSTSNMSSEIRKNMNEISKNQNKFPKFTATYNGKLLDAQMIELTPSLRSFTIAIMNSGEGTAKNIGLALYCSDSSFFDRTDQEYSQWSRLPFVDEPLFKAEYKFQFNFNQSLALSPQEPYPLSIAFIPDWPEGTVNAMLKITHEQGNPKKIFFKVRFKK